MEIEKLYIYPIKSMRGVAVETAILTKYGFPHDRRFMVLQPTEENGEQTFQNISIAPNNELVRFWQDIDSATNTLKVAHKPANGGEVKSIDIPLEPDTAGLDVINTIMHKSPTRAYKMNAKYNDWLTSCLGFDCILAYIGDYKREVRMSSLGYNPLTTTDNNTNGSSWISTLTNSAMSVINATNPPKPAEIGFADVAPYLIASSKSMDSVLSRLPAPEAADYDIVKFRPNIVVRGANAVWEEDFWGQLTIGSAKLECEHNCSRCRSINIDYETGAQGTGEAGTMLKKLAKDRRVDAGAKWNPIFGRYAFLQAEFEGKEVRVGDEVIVSRVNGERTAFDWKGLSTLPGDVKD